MSRLQGRSGCNGAPVQKQLDFGRAEMTLAEATNASSVLLTRPRDPKERFALDRVVLRVARGRVPPAQAMVGAASWNVDSSMRVDDMERLDHQKEQVYSIIQLNYS